MWDFVQIPLVGTCVQGLGYVVESFGNHLLHTISTLEEGVFSGWDHDGVISV